MKKPKFKDEKQKIRWGSDFKNKIADFEAHNQSLLTDKLLKRFMGRNIQYLSSRGLNF
jgi:hypothetical protein